MKAVFSVGGDGDGNIPQQKNYDIGVMFNGLPGTVILEINETTFEGYSGESGNLETRVEKRQKCVMRSALKASEARAIASALLSAATEVQSKVA